MKKYEEMTLKEQNEVIELFSHWLEPYSMDVINYVIKRKDDIISNDVCTVLTSMGKADANKTLSTALCRIVKDNIKELM